MGVKRRRSKRKEPITDAERAWLVGDRANESFTGFPKPGDPDYQARLWRDHGDHKRFQWQTGWPRPQRKLRTTRAGPSCPWPRPAETDAGLGHFLANAAS
jgi:hypothetical protein